MSAAFGNQHHVDKSVSRAVAIDLHSDMRHVLSGSGFALLAGRASFASCACLGETQRGMKVMDIASAAKGRKKVEKMNKTLVTERLPFVRVMDVKVKPDVDIDGEPILMVSIVHDVSGGRTGDKTYGFRTVLHNELNEMGCPGYPITSFIWHKEYGDIA